MSEITSQPRSQKRFVRKQVLITEDQNLRLKALAAATGRSEAELVREAVDAKLEQAEPHDWRASWREAAGMWSDYDQLDERIKAARGSWRKRRERLFGDGD
jgi:exoribonuclease II